MTDSYNYGNINLATGPGDNFLESRPSIFATGLDFLAVLRSNTSPTIVGDAFTYVTSTAEGDSIIINKTGIYQINLTITNSTANQGIAVSISRAADPLSLSSAPTVFGPPQGNISFNSDPDGPSGPSDLTYQLSATVYVSQSDLAQPIPAQINPARIIRVLATPGATINSNSRLFIRAI